MSEFQSVLALLFFPTFYYLLLLSIVSGWGLLRKNWKAIAKFSALIFVVSTTSGLVLAWLLSVGSISTAIAGSLMGVFIFIGPPSLAIINWWNFRKQEKAVK